MGGMRVLVVGSSGFVGSALVDRLIADGCTVDAWDRQGGPAAENLRRVSVDLLSAAPLPAPTDGRWDAAFHLAAHAVTSKAWAPSLAMDNLAMTARVIEHLCLHAPGCRAVLASSSHVYAPSDQPLDEQAPLGPLRLYGLSKQLSEDWALAARQRLDLQIVRPFNQIGPAMPQGLLIPDVLERLARNDAVLTMSGRDDWKDFLDWRDAMDAYLLLMRVDAPSGSIWNLCSGRRTRVSSLIEHIQREMGSEREVRFTDDRVETLVGDPGKLMRATGWSPRRDLRETIQAICAHARSPRP